MHYIEFYMFSNFVQVSEINKNICRMKIWFSLLMKMKINGNICLVFIIVIVIDYFFYVYNTDNCS